MSVESSNKRARLEYELIRRKCWRKKHDGFTDRPWTVSLLYMRRFRNRWRMRFGKIAARAPMTENVATALAHYPWILSPVGAAQKRKPAVPSAR